MPHQENIWSIESNYISVVLLTKLVKILIKMNLTENRDLNYKTVVMYSMLSVCLVQKLD